MTVYPLYFTIYTLILTSVTTFTYAVCPPKETLAEFRQDICNSQQGRQCLCSSNGDMRMSQSMPIRSFVGMTEEKVCGYTTQKSLMSRTEFNQATIQFHAADDTKEYMIVAIDPDSATASTVTLLWLVTNVDGLTLRNGLQRPLDANATLAYAQPNPTSVSRFQIYLFETDANGATLQHLVTDANRGNFPWTRFLQNNNLCDKLVAGFQLMVELTAQYQCVHNATCQPICGVEVLCLEWPTVSCGGRIHASDWQELQQQPTVTCHSTLSLGFYQLLFTIYDGYAFQVVWNVYNLEGSGLRTGTTAIAGASVKQNYRLPTYQSDRVYTINAYLIKQPMRMSDQILRNINMTTHQTISMINTTCIHIVAMYAVEISSQMYPGTNGDSTLTPTPTGTSGTSRKSVPLLLGILVLFRISLKQLYGL